MPGLLKHLRKDKSFMDQITKWKILAAKEAVFDPLPGELNPVLGEILAKRNIKKLYSHQASAYNVIRGGDNAVIVTPTASGKTLCYNLPVLQHLLEDGQARALYLFPTKALSHDQQGALNELILDKDLSVKVCTYDGDTPGSQRLAARKSGRVIISNMDMLHAGILPNHTKWINFLKSLKYVVVDEVHMYRGVFGAHVANVMRRLKRILAFYGSKPRFIASSATIGNPRELAEKVCGVSMKLINNNGAPTGEKHFLLYNPPYVDRGQGIRRGTVLEGQSIALKFLKADVKTIIFARSRVRTELIASYINNAVQNIYTDNGRIVVESYRGGYLPSERRAIETGLRDGSINGVVSTNALELGIDIGGLDAAVMTGFPGSIASTWQQAGRAGRSSSVSAAVLLASNGPLDQYVINHEEYFFGRSPEEGHLDPDNIYILLDHLKCSLFEIPFKEGEAFGARTDDLLAYLEENGIARRTGGSYYWAAEGYPAELISLRSATNENVAIIDRTGGKHEVIGEMDRPSAKELIYENAVYIHRGNQYLVKNLDIEKLTCSVERSNVNYYTDAVTKRDIKVLEIDDTEDAQGTRLVLTDVLVRSQVAKFKKIKFKTHENIGYGEVHLPEEEMHTRSAVITFNEGTPTGDYLYSLDENITAKLLSGLGNIINNTSPLFLLCNPSDIGIAEHTRDPHFDAPSVFLYDKYPGGIGLSESFMEKAPRVFEAVREVLRNCGCKSGCPSCIGPVAEEDELIDINVKQTALEFMDLWLENNIIQGEPGAAESG